MLEHWQVLSSVSNSTLTGEHSLGLAPPQGQTLLLLGSTRASSEGTKPKNKGVPPLLTDSCAWVGMFPPRYEHTWCGVGSQPSRKGLSRSAQPSPCAWKLTQSVLLYQVHGGWDSSRLLCSPLSGHVGVG